MKPPIRVLFVALLLVAAGLGKAATGAGVLNLELTGGVLASVVLRSRWMRVSAPSGTRPEV